jgi:Lon-like protease
MPLDAAPGGSDAPSPHPLPLPEPSTLGVIDRADFSGPPAGPRRRHGVVWTVLLSVLVIAVAIGGYKGFIQRYDWLTLSPGSARDVTDGLTIEGTEIYPPDGTILFLTVSVSRDLVNGVQYLRAELDDEIDLVPEEQITGGRSRDEVREENAALIRDSKFDAERVALDYLGIEYTYTGTGVTILDVAADAPAGDLLHPGDVVTAIDGTPTPTDVDLRDIVQAAEPGDVLSLTVEPAGGGDVVAVDVPTVESEGRTILGVLVDTRDFDLVLPFDIDFDTGTVGGPSAGLAFSLALIDELTPGELTGGRVVAVTGQIALDGTVLPIGGAAQKAVAAREAGADLMLVPAATENTDNYADAERLNGDMEVRPVATLEEAIAVLAEEYGGNGAEFAGAFADDGQS